MKIRLSILFVISLFVCVAVSSAQEVLPRDNGIFTYHSAPDYRESESHPLRTVAYVLHPIGWVLREAFYRPWSYFASSSEFTRSFFGYRDPYDFRDTVCFNPDADVPDCALIPPYSKIGYGREAEGDGDVSAQKQVCFPDVAFDYNKSTLNALGKGRIRQIAQLLSADPSLNVVLEGNTDSRGSDDYNMKLAAKRSESVSKELTDLGVDPARLTTVSKGEATPIFTESEDWAFAVNRRVRVVVGGEE
ncbi:MAG: OmpA family protein [Deltaproteobacteria bacterium]|nr:OmpA family protein [Deltaproteobacteria bacterium]